jgi:hypothetical protein
MSRTATKRLAAGVNLFHLRGIDNSSEGARTARDLVHLSDAFYHRAGIIRSYMHMRKIRD